MTDVVKGEVLDDPSGVAHAQQEEIKRIVRTMRRSWIDLAGQLYDFNANRRWLALGIPTFEEWLAGPDIDIQRRHVFGLIEIWRTLVVEQGVPPAHLDGIGSSKLRAVLPAVRRGTVAVQDAIADARVLSREDMREKYDRALFTGPSSELEATAEPAMMRCPTCGSWLKEKK